MSNTSSILPVLNMPAKYITARRDLSNNGFVQWLRNVNWSETKRMRIEEVLNMYYISSSREGHAIFWQIDERGGVRTGKMVKVGEEVSWIHDTMMRAGLYDPSKWRVENTLFGMHLLTTHPHAQVNIVGTEVEAILASIAYGYDYAVWMALGSAELLTKEALQPIIKQNRVIYFYPSARDVELYTEKANEIKTEYRRIAVHNFVKNNKIDDDSNLADLVLMSASKEPLKPSEALVVMSDKNPELRRLIDSLSLELIKPE